MDATSNIMIAVLLIISIPLGIFLVTEIIKDELATRKYRNAIKTKDDTGTKLKR